MKQRSVEMPGIDCEPSFRTKLRRIVWLGWKELSQLVVVALTSWLDHNVPRRGAALAFYCLLSLAPLLIIVVAVAGAVFGREAAQGQLIWQIQDLIGREGAEIVQTLLAGSQKPVTGLATTLFGFLTLFWGAGLVVAELRGAMNTIWCVTPRAGSKITTIFEMIKDRTIAFAIVLGIGFLLLISLTINAALTAIGSHFHAALPVPPWVFKALDFAVTYIVIAVLFAAMYKWLPALYIEWRDVILGALLTSLLFGVGKYAIGIYLGTAGIATTYGAAGSLVVVLLWVYYSAQIFFLGAEFTRAYAQLYGSHPCDRPVPDVQLVSSIDKPEQRSDEPKLIIQP
jgi:membrane protein